MWYLVNGVGKHKTWILKVFNAMDVTHFHTKLAYSWTSSVQDGSNLAKVVFCLLAKSIWTACNIHKYFENLEIIKAPCAKGFQLVTYLNTVHSYEYYLE